MHAHFLDPYIERRSPIHLLDPRLKLVLVLAFILTSALTPIGAWPVYILLFALVLAAEVLSELGVGNVLKRSLLAFPFVLAALPLVFTIPGDILFSLQIGSWFLNVSLPGLERFISIALKSWISVQAAILLAKFEIFPEEVRLRDEVARRYNRLLKSSPPLVTPPEVPEGYDSVWAQYSILAGDGEIRSRLMGRLKEAGIPSVIYYPKPLHLQPAFSYLGYNKGNFPVSESCAARIFSLPMHPYLQLEDQERIVNLLAHPKTVS